MIEWTAMKKEEGSRLHRMRTLVHQANDEAAYTPERWRSSSPYASIQEAVEVGDVYQYDDGFALNPSV
jgi:hypothetical protein